MEWVARDAPYSPFNAFTGSTFAARFAGNNPASSETTAAPTISVTQNFRLTEKIESGISSASSGSNTARVPPHPGQ